MQAGTLADLTAFISISIAFMNTVETAGRVLVFETITGLRAILDQVGTPLYLQRFYKLWTAMTHSLALLEHMHLPTLPQETRVHFIPQRPRSLVSLLEPEFVQHLHKVQ